jgi:hypothetical protein
VPLLPLGAAGLAPSPDSAAAEARSQRNVCAVPRRDLQDHIYAWPGWAGALPGHPASHRHQSSQCKPGHLPVPLTRYR